MAHRPERLNELIKVELGNIFLREMDFPVDSLITITRVETAPDLMSAKVFISVFPEKLTESVFRRINAQIYFFQQKLNKRLLIRPVPRLVFQRENNTAVAGRVEELLDQVKEKPVEKHRRK